MVIATVVVTLLAIPASGRTAKLIGIEDPGLVVIDEVAGVFVTMLFHPLTITSVVLGFFLFRIADILKPFPARRLERLHGGVGIVMDDIVSGIYANLALLLILRFLP